MAITTPITRVVIAVISLLIMVMLILETVVITMPITRVVITAIFLLTMVMLMLATM
ncbi:hypothetical protein JEM48_06875, partial [Ligilactobacillus salivarius]|nr:hypothetical protein [Ligilactobacillus salivarius]